MKKTKLLTCDVDGVLANYNKAFSEILAPITGGPIINDSGKDSVQHWDWEKWYPGATRKDVATAWKILKNTKNFWAELEPVDTGLTSSGKIPALEALDLLSAEMDIYFVTSRIPTEGYSPAYQTQLWLMKYGFLNPNVIVTSEKNKLAALLKANIMIDDKTEYFNQELLDLNPHWEHLALINYKHNELFQAPNTVQRYDSINEVLKYITG